MIIAKFKTGYLQREIYLDAVIADDLVTWQAVKVTPASGDTPAQVAAASTAEEATHILAQGDTTAKAYGHVDVEHGRHDTWNYVKASAESEWKHVALFKIMDTDDVIFEEVAD